MHNQLLQEYGFGFSGAKVWNALRRHLRFNFSDSLQDFR